MDRCSAREVQELGPTPAVPRRRFCQVKERAKSLSRVQLCDLMDDGPPVASVHGILQNTGVDCHFLLPGIFQTQGVNLPVLLMSPALAGGFLYN